MKGDLMTVREMAELSGITVRTLHHYDQIGLLNPAKISSSGYRLYSDTDLIRLQEILFLREIGFALKDISMILKESGYERQDILEKHLVLLYEKRKQMDEMILMLQAELDGSERNATRVHTSSKIRQLQEQFYQEVLDRWKDTESFRIYEKRQSCQTKKHQVRQIEEFQTFSEKIFQRLAQLLQDGPECDAVQALVAQWQSYISQHFYPCDKKMLRNLGALYSQDPRFSDFINNAAQAEITQFWCEAIHYFCK